MQAHHMKICSYICTTLLRIMKEFSHMEDAAYMLKAIAHSTRLCVISLLAKEDELNVTEISEQLQCEQSLLSHHLTNMRARGILNCRKEGKNCFYSLKNKQITKILDCIQSSQCVE